MASKDYDSTIARMAGNIAAGLVARPDVRLPGADSWESAEVTRSVAIFSVRVAVDIVRLCKEATANELNQP